MNGGEAIGSVSLLRMLTALALVVGLILLTAWIFRRLNGQRLPKRGAARTAMRISSTLPLGDRRFLAVVEVEKRRFLLGVAAQAVSMLAELEETDENGATEPPAGEFAGLLEKARQAFRREGK
jgi:flagellar protein FliO/FliZ